MKRTLIAVCIAFNGVAFGQVITTNCPDVADVDIRSYPAPSPDLGYNRTVLIVFNKNADPALAEDGKAYIRFRLPPDFGTVTSATFTMTRDIIGTANWTYNVYGLDQGPIPGSPWTTLTWPELDGGNGTNAAVLGTNATTWNDAPGNVIDDATNFTSSEFLGTYTVSNAANGGHAGDSYSMSGTNLVNFLNEATNYFVTLMVSRNGVSSSGDQWASKELGTYPGPALSITYTPSTNVALGTLASERWNAWRTNRNNYFTAAWQALYLYTGTSNEYQTYYDANLNSVQSPSNEFDVASSVGLDVILGSWEGISSNYSKLAEYVNYPSSNSTIVTGYMLEEEPPATDFPQLAESTGYIYRNDQRNAIPIVVQLPNWAVGYDRFGLGNADGSYYNTYIDKYVHDVSPCVMICDNYPIYGDGTDSTNYYPNIEYFRDLALTNNIGLMGFALVTSYTNGDITYRQPSESDLNWEVYSYVAYGADGMFYEDWRRPPTDDTNYGEGLVTQAADTPTVTYYMVQEVDQELNNIWPVFQHLKSVDVFHTGSPVPMGTTPYIAGASSAISAFTGNNFIIGDFTNMDDSSDNSLYVMLVNKRHGASYSSSSQTYTATFTTYTNWPNVSIIDPSNGVRTALAASAGQYSLAIGGGKGVLLEFSPPTLFEAWAQSYGLSGTNAELTADPDGDQVNNLYEFAFDGNPTNGDVTGISPVCQIITENGTNWIQYTYVRRTDSDSGLTYQLELSKDLISWTNSGYIETGTAAVDAHFEDITNRISTEDKAEQFIRLEVDYQ